MPGPHQPYLNTDFFEVINTPDKAYWFGFLFGDGYMHSTPMWWKFSKYDRLSLVVRLHEKDYAHLYTFASIFRENPVISKISTRPHIGFTIHNQPICISLYDKGIRPRKSLVKICGVGEFIPDDLVRHFARGLIDADGHISKSRTSVSIANGSFEALRLIQHHAPVMGHLSSEGNIYALKFHKDYNQLYDWLYTDAEVSLTRKALVAHRWRHTPQTPKHIKVIAEQLAKAMFDKFGARAYELDLSVR